MRATRRLILFLAVFQALLICISHWRYQLLRHLIIGLGLAALVLGAALVVTFFVGRVRGRPMPWILDSNEKHKRADFLDIKVLILVAIALVAVYFVGYLTSYLSSKFILYIASWGIFASTGALLSVWCRSQFHVPILTALVIGVGMATIYLVKFVSTAIPRYGPEALQLAIRELAHAINGLPLYVAVMLGAWCVAEIVKNSGQRRKMA